MGTGSVKSVGSCLYDNSLHCLICRNAARAAYAPDAQLAPTSGFGGAMHTSAHRLAEAAACHLMHSYAFIKCKRGVEIKLESRRGTATMQFSDVLKLVAV